MRPMPLQLALIRSTAYPRRQLELMANQVPPPPVHRPTAGQLIENQLKGRLNLGIGIFNNLAGRTAHLAHRHRHPQFAAFGLGAFTRQQALFQHMQLRCRHGPLQSKYSTPIQVVEFLNTNYIS